MVAGKSKQEEEANGGFHALSKVAVAQICRSSGFKRCHPSALDALTRISSLFLLSLSRSASSSASLSGRTHSNLLDFLSALEHLSSPFGFLPGASLLRRRCLLKSPALRDLRSFVRSKPELPPFAHPIPAPRRGGDHQGPGRGHQRSGRRMEIPPWLPELPDLRDGNQDPKRKELYWEEMSPQLELELELELEVFKGVVVDKRRKMLPLERDRVKFRVWGKDTRRRKTTTKLLL